MSRVDALRNLLNKDPKDSMTRYMLANELFKAAEFTEAIEQMTIYTSEVDDEGAAYRVLAQAYLELGQQDHAKDALRQGARAARTHDHAGMVEEFEDKLADLE